MADDKLLENTSPDEFEKLKQDIANLNEYYKQESMRQSKYIDESDSKDQKIKVKHEIEKEYDSRKLKEPIINKRNFEKYIASQVKYKELKKINLSLINYKSLKGIITYTGSYPENARKYIWTFLLSLPNNRGLFSKYASKGLHPFCKNISDIYPVADQKYLRELKVICSLLSFWSPHIGNIYFLPNIVFPFIKTIQGDDIFIFETLIAIFNSTCRYWFELYPNMPVKHIEFACDIIKKEIGTEIEKTLSEMYISVGDVIWRLMTNFFSESFDKKDWLSFVDFIITYNHKPEMMLYFSCAFIIKYKEDIIFNKNNMKRLKQILFDIKEKRNIVQLFKETLKLQGKYSKTQKYHYTPYIPFPDNEYPVMDKFPLDFLKTTAQIKDDFAKGKLDINEEFEISKNNKRALEQKYQELLEKEKQIEYAYQDMLEMEREKNEILKRDLDVILYKKEKVFRDLKKIK